MLSCGYIKIEQICWNKKFVKKKIQKNMLSDIKIEPWFHWFLMCHLEWDRRRPPCQRINPRYVLSSGILDSTSATCEIYATDIDNNYLWNLVPNFRNLDNTRPYNQYPNWASALISFVVWTESLIPHQPRAHTARELRLNFFQNYGTLLRKILWMIR